MAYLGAQPVYGTVKKIDSIAASFDGVTQTFNLLSNSVAFVPGVAAALIISIDGVLQEPINAYTVNGSQITFTSAPAAGQTFFGVSLGSSVTIASVANTNITGNVIQSQITSIANTQITGLITSGQIATVANTQITGNIISSQLAPTGVSATSYGSASAIPVITVDQQGRITTATTATLNAASTGKAIAMAMVFGG
jgi:hypothetical protein